MNSQSLNILLSGGGTGGHLFPGIAIARKFLERDPESRILFVGVGNAFETTALSREGFRHRQITASGLKGLSWFEKIASLVKLPRGLFESIRIIREYQPHVVIGLGGYSSGPVILASWLLNRLGGNIGVAIQEQNTIPGVTNRILGKLADRIFISFPGSARFFTPAKLRHMGNPVRNEIVSARARTKKEAPEGRFTVLILGGSQGAHRINLLVMEALSRLKTKTDFFFIHQTGEKDWEMVQGAYREAGIPCDVRPFFENMAETYMACDLIVARAGATTVAEIMVMGKPAIFIPYPFAADNHQEMNARELVNAGAAEMMIEASLTGELLAEKFDYYRDRKELLAAMSEKALKQGRPEAAAAIVDECRQMAGGMN